MENWSRRKRKREEGDDEGDQVPQAVVDDVVVEVETAPGTCDEQGPSADVEHHETVDNIVDVDDKKETLVARVRKKFDTHSPTLNCDMDFASWKRRREELRRKKKLSDSGQCEEGAQGGDEVTDIENVRKKTRLSSVPETGAKLKYVNITNQYCSSLLGGKAGVHSEDGAQGDIGGGVRPAQTASMQQCTTRMVGTFFLSADRQYSAAATVGKTGSVGNDSTKTARK